MAPGSLARDSAHPKATEVHVQNEPGRVIADRYELQRVLGRGGSSIVWAGLDRRLGRPVAVQELLPEVAADPARVEAFRRGAAQAASVRDDRVVEVYDWGVGDGGAPYLAMELVDGPDLASVLDRDGPLRPEAAATLGSDLASGLAAVHRAGLVDGALRPSDVLLSGGRAKLTGLAGAFGGLKAVGAPDGGIEAARWTSPEQARGEQPDARSDLYALGGVLFAMVAGRPPFLGDDPVEVAQRHATESVSPPSRFAAGVPIGYDAVVDRLLSKEPAARYTSAGEVAADLDRVAATLRTGAPTAAAPVADATRLAPAAVVTVVTPPRTDDKGGMPGWAWALIAGVVAIVAVVIAFAIFNGGDNDSGGGDVTVPAVVGINVNTAQQTLRDAGLRPNPEAASSETVPLNNVISQNPAAGTRVADNTLITLMVSSGPAPTTTTTRAPATTTTAAPATTTTAAPTTTTTTTTSAPAPTTTTTRP